MKSTIKGLEKVMKDLKAEIRKAEREKRRDFVFGIDHFCEYGKEKESIVIGIGFFSKNGTPKYHEHIYRPNRSNEWSRYKLK